MASISSIKECLRSLIDSDAPQGLVLVAYLFGSFACGHERPKSDIDLAFLLDRRRYRADAFEAAAPVHMIAAKLGIKLRREVDVTILNTASLEIAFEVVCFGKCLFQTDADARLEYAIKIRGMYFDFEPFLSGLRARKIASLKALGV
jgi:predicted nucleotidyltransferase